VIKTFEDLAAIFPVWYTVQYNNVILDNYRHTSIKNGTGIRRGKQIAIMKEMSSRNVSPVKWVNFVAYECNMKILGSILFITTDSKPKSLLQYESEAIKKGAESSYPSLDIKCLEQCQENSDTRTIPHLGTKIVVSASDVFVMLIAFFHLTICHKVWMWAGTAKKREFVQIRAILRSTFNKSLRFLSIAKLPCPNRKVYLFLRPAQELFTYIRHHHYR
jgi:hypothetical protein